MTSGLTMSNCMLPLMKQVHLAEKAVLNFSYILRNASRKL